MAIDGRLRIAQVAPLYERVPPVLYGGTERIVSYLTEELVKRDHDVTLFASGDSITQAQLVLASGDSITQAKLVSASPTSLRLNPAMADPLVYHYLLLEQVMQRAEEFDL